MNAVISSALEEPVDSRHSRFLTCAVDQLHPHPCLVQLQIIPSARDLSAAIAQRDYSIEDPLTITQDGFILAGYARWDLARRNGEKALRCLQLDLTNEDALLWIVRRHQRSATMNDFSRILVALELEPWFKARARSNQQVGGQMKGSSNLTKADKLDVRSEIAAAAGVSAGSVSKAKQLAMNAHPAVLDALRMGEVSIDRASAWLRTPEKQSDNLRLHRMHLSKRGITGKINSLLRAHRVPPPADNRVLDVQRIGRGLAAMSSERTASILVSAIQVPDETLLLSAGLLQALQSQGGFHL
jgi:hypothetical protein